MEMIMTPNHTFVTAYFTNDERLTIQSYWTDEQTGDYIEYVIEVKEGDADYENLLEHITIDELHENTYQNIKASEEAIKEQVIAIAKERGWIYDISTDNNTEIYKAIANLLFREFDAEKHKETLFFTKLELFEQDGVKKCKDKNLKKQLRKAPDIVTCIELACKIFRANLEAASPQPAD